MSDGDTLSYVGQVRDAGGGRAISPYLVVALECQNPLAPPQRLSLATAEEVLIGRGPERSHVRFRDREGEKLRLFVADGWMSSKHVRMSRDAGAWVVQDAGSKNGTFVNGAQAKTVRLRDGDLIEAGSTIFLFRDPPKPMVGGPPDLDVAELESKPAGMITLSVTLAKRLEGLPRVAGSDVPVILRGETGTGKEVVARALHELSGRSGRFVGVNCGALPRELIESELFGHKRGSFSGASDDRAGLVRDADAGTLFLDEVAELPESSQVALLRVLQEREVRPVGGSDVVGVDIRVIAATHQDLGRRVEKGLFREDLYSRLAGLTVVLPPLRDRREDIGLLVGALLTRITPGRAPKLRIDREAGRALFAYDWPRNVRELEHALRSAVALTTGDTIECEQLPEEVTNALSDLGSGERSPEDEALHGRLVELLTLHKGNVRAVARDMEKAPVQIYRWLKRLQIDVDSFR